MLHLDVNDENDMINEHIEALVANVLTHAAKEEGLLGEIEVSVTFLSDEEIQAVNAEYRGIDKPTDVISFALEEMVEGEVAIIAEQDMPTVLGDIIISVDTANRQAKDYNHTVDREIGFLALHGFLHLLGYDHMTAEDEAKMFGRQKEILDSLGLER